MRLSSQLSTALHLTNIAVYGAVWATRYVSLLLLPSLDEVDVTSGTYYAFYIAAGVRATSIQLNRYSGCFLLHARSSMGDMLTALCCVHSMNGFLCYFRLVTYLSFKCVVRAASFHPSRVSVLISSHLTVPRLQLSLAPCGGLRVRYVHHCTVSRLILW